MDSRQQSDEQSGGVIDREDPLWYYNTLVAGLTLALSLTNYALDPTVVKASTFIALLMVFTTLVLSIKPDSKPKVVA